jgi:DNA repair ATPase RecN
MAAGNLDTTNVLLGIMAAVSVLEALLLIGLGVMGYRLYSQAMRTIRDIEQRQVAPLMMKVDALVAKVDGILADVKDVTSRVTHQTERVDSAIRHTMDRVDETAGRVRDSVAQRLNRIAGLARWAKSTIETIFNGQRRTSRAAAAGR